MTRHKPVNEPRVAAVVLAGGSGVRAGAGRNKVYLPLAGRTIVARSLATMAELPGLSRLILVIRPEDAALAHGVLTQELRHPPVAVEVVTGGPTRHASEEHALYHLAAAVDAGSIDVILIHDAARPLGSRQLAAEVAHAAVIHGGAVPGVAADDLVRVDADGAVEAPVRDCVRIQTPQAFAAAPLLAAYRAAAEIGFEGTDTSACIERFTSLQVRYVPGEQLNFKITHPGDLLLAEQFLRRHVAGAPEG